MLLLDLPLEVLYMIGDLATLPKVGDTRVSGPGHVPAFAYVCRCFLDLWRNLTAFLPSKLYLDRQRRPVLDSYGQEIFRADIRACQNSPWRVRETLVFDSLRCFRLLWMNYARDVERLRAIKFLSITYHDSTKEMTVTSSEEWQQQFSQAWFCFHSVRIMWNSLIQDGGHSLSVIRVQVPVWQSIRSMDAPGMFELSLLRQVRRIVFVAQDHQAISKYIEPRVRKVIQQRLRWSSKRGWEETGLENPCPRANWKAQAARRGRNGESETQAQFRYLSMWYQKHHDKS